MHGKPVAVLDICELTMNWLSCNLRGSGEAPSGIKSSYWWSKTVWQSSTLNGVNLGYNASAFGLDFYLTVF